ncbi:PilZ domain-containing protein [Aurantiacibacter luteus]|uniref:PilZ domain-containing protein n=1 Tax=Aurantiacibacter luteus TaxID=1581420 RepID=UPI00069A2107|nr:PilZ domain-containing protein [Aurantiacibacter luteus]
MKLFMRAKPDPHPERRAAARVRVNAPAKLLMPSGDRPGHIFDVSTDGARFMTQSPPPKGMSAILEWADYEAYCMVSWQRPGMCGVEFDRPISQQAVDRLARECPAGPRSLMSLPDLPDDDDPLAEPRAPVANPYPPRRRFMC